MNLSIDQARQAGDSIWKVDVDRNELRLLGNHFERIGDVSVVLLTRPPRFGPEGRLEFEVASAHLLNLGRTADTIVISGTGQVFGREVADDRTAAAAQESEMVVSGDREFLEALQELPQQLRELGRDFLVTVRNKYSGELEYHRHSGKFVNRPDNFWVIKIQPRDESFRITVRGSPERFQVGNAIELKRDRNGYCAFKIEGHDQLQPALDLIRQAVRKRRYS